LQEPFAKGKENNLLFHSLIVRGRAGHLTWSCPCRRRHDYMVDDK
jgi:hypothetical protein